jgi:hypothetical protein
VEPETPASLRCQSTLGGGRKVVPEEIHVTRLDKVETLPNGRTPNRERCDGEADLIRVTLGRETRLTLGYVRWANGEREVRALHIDEGPERFDGIRNRCVLSITSLSSDLSYCALKVALYRNDPAHDRPTLHPVSPEDLDVIAGCDVSSALLAQGARQVDRRSEIVGAPEGGPDFVCASFPRENWSVPVHAFALTRVLPVKHSRMK